MTAEFPQAVANYAQALDELNVPELEAVLTEDTTWTFTMPGQGVLGPVAGRAAVLDSIWQWSAGPDASAWTDVGGPWACR